MKRLTVTMLLALLCSCTLSTSPRIHHQMSNQIDDDTSGIMLSLGYYGMAATATTAVYSDQLTDDTTDIINRFLYCVKKEIDKHVSERVRILLDQDREMLYKLFNVSPENSLEADYRFCSVEIIYPLGMVCPSEGDRKGRYAGEKMPFHVVYTTSSNLMSPQAVVELEFSIFPPSSESEKRSDGHYVFTNRRHFCLSKEGDTWVIISDRA